MISRIPVEVPAAGTFKRLSIRGRTVYVEESPANTPEDVPSFHLHAGGGGFPCYSRSSFSWLPGFREFYIKGTAAASGSTLYLLIFEDPCGEGVYGSGSIINPSPCADAADPFVEPDEPDSLVFVTKDASWRVNISSSLDGGSETELDDQPGQINGVIGYDAVADRVYIATVDAPGVKAIDPSGGALAGVSGAASSFATSGDFDKANRRIFFGRGSQISGQTGIVYRYVIVGAVRTTLWNTAVTDEPQVAYDPNRNLVYAALRSAGEIHRMDDDGANRVLVYNPATTLDGLSIDPWNGYLYFFEDDDIRRLHLGTLAVTTLVSGAWSGAGATPGYLQTAIDLRNNRIYWGDDQGDQHYYADLDTGANQAAIVYAHAPNRATGIKPIDLP